MIFYAEPKDLDAPLKSIPDFESTGAAWVPYAAFIKEVESGTRKLRGMEPYEWFRYVEKKGTIFPLEVMTYEGADVNIII